MIVKKNLAIPLDEVVRSPSPSTRQQSIHIPRITQLETNPFEQRQVDHDHQ